MRILKSRGVEVLVCLLLISVIFNPTVLKNCFAQVFGPQSLFFDELKTQFVQANAITVIPIGVNSLGNGSRVALNISGVPGASLQYVTNLSTPGPRAAANLILQNPAPGNYTCRVYGIDMLSGNNSISTTFEIFVNGPQNLSPTISPVALPISAHRSFGAPSNLNLGISGLPGQFTMDKYVNSPTDVSGTLIWQAAVAPGLYTLKIEVSDTQGAYSTLSVPVLVVSGTTAYPAPVFDELKTQFLATNVDAIIPIGVNALDNSSKIVLTEVVGLPGAALQMVTNPASPGPRAAANLIWKPYAQGQYTCCAAYQRAQEFWRAV
ncbi:MAG: hypothetical protein HZB36_07405 [Candidatus Omnitrophica bacterium]|nr:hypothetical protein [Candidatus Omnitrophota bacterium]